MQLYFFDSTNFTFVQLLELENLLATISKIGKVLTAIHGIITIIQIIKGNANGLKRYHSK